MAVPLSADRFVKALRDEGLRVVEYKTWRTHNRNHVGPWGPVNGVMIHHTVTSGTASSVELCYNGHSNLPGPLCHGVIAKDGTVYLVGNGRANHAGLGDPDVLQAVIDERPLPADNEASTDGNRHFYGFECVNLGDGLDPWPAAQLEAIERVSAALCRAHGWSWRSVIRHLDWQPGKVDPRGVDWPAMQVRISNRIGDGPEEEIDVTLTSEQAKQLKYVYDNLKSDPWRFKNENLEPVRDTYQVLRDIDDIAKQIKADTGDLGTVTLTSEQVASLASLVAGDEGLSDTIADKVAERLAARLAE